MTAPERRRFNTGERITLYLEADGRCSRCGNELTPGWHADHVDPYSTGGPTEVLNGQALCPACNLKKGSRRMRWTGPEPREWQRAALDTYHARSARDFLTVATPGAGKTKLALRLAWDLLDRGIVHRIVIVVPSEHLKSQWASAAHECGLEIDPTTKNSNGIENRTDYVGAAVTYAQVAAAPEIQRHGVTRYRTLVILDEVHHAGDERAWGDATRSAFDHAERRLALSGTPFRSDDKPIPFVDYELCEDGVQRSKADYTYGYGRAISDRVCRQVDFHFYDGEMRWMASDAVTSSAKLSAELAKDDASKLLETALDPATGWMEGLLRKADGLLTQMRQEVPKAGGLVIAYRGEQARAYARMLKKLTGEDPVVVLSEDGPEAKAAIDRFADGSQRWLVAVRMVSEGVDVPRLAVGVYATKTKTEMFFRQAIGRFVRRQGAEDEQIATVFAPALSGLRIMAAEIENEIRHELEAEDQEIERAIRAAGPSTGEQPSLFDFIPLGASEPTLHGTILGGQEFSAEINTRAEELMRRLDFPASAMPALRRLVRESDEREAASAPVTVLDRPATETPVPVGVPLHRKKTALARKLATASRRLAIARGGDFRGTEWRINQAMGVSRRSDATIEQLQRGLEYAERMLREIG